MKFLLSLLLIIFASCSTSPSSSDRNEELFVVETSPTKWTAFTKQNLYQLNSIYDLSPILFSKNIYIESKTLSKPFPYITLNTRYAEDPKKLLSALIHEELFWWERSQSDNFEKAKKELIKTYPKSSLKDRGLLLICYLEYEALNHYLGQKEALEIIQSKVNKDKVLPWFYAQTISKGALLKRIVSKYKIAVFFDIKN